MAGAEQNPVARVWRLSDGDLTDPAVEQVLRTMTLPRAEEVPGFLGMQVPVDADGTGLHGAAYWGDPEAERSSRDFGRTALGALQGLTTATLEGPSVVEVLLSRFQGSLSPALPVADLTTVLVCTRRLVGPEAGEPQVTAALTAELLADLDLPGCVGVLVVRPPEAAAVVAQTFWETAPTRTLDGSSTEKFHVLVNEPITWPPTGG